jgi:hypothetical protein
MSCIVQPPIIFTAYDNGPATGGAACFVTGSPPEVTLLSPGDSGIKRVSDENFSCYASVDTALKNMTLYVWGSGGLYNRSMSDASGFTALKYWTVSMDEEDTYQWNCRACDASSRCAFGPENRTFTVLSASRLNLKLFLNGTAAVYLPGSGSYNSSLVSVTDSAPSHFYATSTSGGAFSGLVFSGYVPRFIAAGNGSENHYIELSQDVEGSRAFLAFSPGDWNTVEGRIGAIEAGDFMRQTLPSFSYGLGGRSELGIALFYSSLDLEGRMKLEKGTHRITVENNGTYGGRPSIVLRVR